MPLPSNSLEQWEHCQPASILSSLRNTRVTPWPGVLYLSILLSNLDTDEMRQMTDGNCQQASEAGQYLRKTVVDCHLKISSFHTNNSTSWKPLPSKKDRQYYAVSDKASCGSVGGRVKSADCFLYLMTKKIIHFLLLLFWLKRQDQVFTWVPFVHSLLSIFMC